VTGRLHFLPSVLLLLCGGSLQAQSDFWLIPNPGGKSQVRVIEGGDAGIRVAELGEEGDDVDDRGTHWKATYRILRWDSPKDGYVVTRHWQSYTGPEGKNFVKAFDGAEKLRFSLGPIVLTPLAMAKDSARIALGRIGGTEIARGADFLVFTDGKGAVAYKEAGQFTTLVRFSPSGDWVAYVAGNELVMRQFSTNKEYRKSLVEVANRSGSPANLVRQFATVTDEGILKYHFKTVGSYQEQHVDSDRWMKSYDPKD
jgi:hypothetical protein